MNPKHRRSPKLTHAREPIAIIGIGCRFPGGANNPLSFWNLLLDGVDAIGEVPADRWNVNAIYDSDHGKPGKSQTRWGGFLSNIDQFDPGFFGISPREAARMDPQQRLLLETAWEALEDGGQALDKLAGSRTAVYVGISSWDFSAAQTSFRDLGIIDVHTNTGGSLSIAANRVSYSLDLRGPSASVDTACSSALVAVHLACQSIWTEGTALALVGGVNLLLLPEGYVGFSRLGMLSPHGRCRAFDARGDGFVRSEGAGMVLLKPLSHALRDRDRVYAVIRGTAVNQDGRTNGMTVPSQHAQEELLREACASASINPGQIYFVEAHGTGTPVGDPIEARALGNVLSNGRSADQPCLLGSVKTNIGHLEAGAGIAGLIKTALVLKHRRLPGNLHFEQPNPDIDFAGLKLRVVTNCEPLPSGAVLAGINSFGFGGTNAHVILETPPREIDADQARDAETPSLARRAQAITVSARSSEAVRTAATTLQQFVEASADASLYDIAAHSALRRTHHDHRLTVVAHTKEELCQRLGEFVAGQASPDAIYDRAASGNRPRLAFVCSGQGPQWWAMGRQLLADEPVFRDTVKQCDEIMRHYGSWSVLEELTRDEQASRMHETSIAQPALFAMQVALAALWESWGVRPDAVVGHSVGEVAAAYLAGIFSLEEAARIIYQRGRCMECATGRGAMLAAGLTPDEAQHLVARFPDLIALAAVNSPTSVTLSGEPALLQEIARGLEEKQIFCRSLKVQYAFHSPQMEPVRDLLLPALDGIRPKSTRIPFISTVMGYEALGPELGPEYWWQNVRQTVRFADAMTRLTELNCDLVLEVGPHPVLASAIAECFQHHGHKPKIMASLRRQEEERAVMLRSVGQLHAAGYPIYWQGIFSEPACFVSLPTYSWQRERCWHESPEALRSRLANLVHPLLGRPLTESLPAWENRLDIKLFPYITDHRVQRAVIVPATAFVETLFAAARETFGQAGCRLENVKLPNPCFLANDKPLRVQTVFQPEIASALVQTRLAEDASAWTVNCRGTLRGQSPHPSAGAFDPDLVKQRCPREFSSEECIAYSRQIGLDYGPAFQGIRQTWKGDGEALGLVCLPEGLANDQYLFHPALLDACFQVGICASPAFMEPDAGLYLPAEIDQIRLLGKPGGKVWCHVRMIETTTRSSVLDLDVYNENLEVVLQVRGLRSQRVAGGSIEDSLDDLLYAYQWQPQPKQVESPVPSVNGESLEPDAPAREAPGGDSVPPSLAQSVEHWLVFADRAGLGDRLAKKLRGHGHTCITVSPGPEFSSMDGERYRINPGRLEDMVRLIEEVRTNEFHNIVHLWNLDAPPATRLTADQLEDVQDATLFSPLHIVQAWDKVAGNQAGRLLLVTRGAQAVGEPADGLAMAQSPAIGLGRVITNEYPRLRCKLIDLDPGDDEAALRDLADEVNINDDEDEVAWRAGQRHVPRYLAAGNVTRAPRRPEQDGYRLLIARPGTLDGLVTRAFHRTKPEPGQVEIEVAASGMNFSDLMKVLGLYPGLPAGPIPLGAECSGKITAVGDGVPDFQIGDEVLGIAPFAFASHVTTRADLVARKPANLTFEEAATIPIVFLTAAYALNHLGRLEAGERVLIHSASGGLGLAAIQLARLAGADIFATAGSPEKRAYLQDLGIRHVFDSRTLAFADEVLERTGGRGVDAVLNSLAGEALLASFDVLADYGRFLEVGKRDIYQNARLGMRPFRKNLSFFAIDLDRVMRDRPAFLGDLLRKMMEDFAAGRLTPLPHQDFALADVAGAFRLMQQAKHVGKLVLSVGAAPEKLAPAEDEPLSFRGDATYLITGGLGGFGLAVARWIVERGARHLVLAGRRGAATEEAQQAIEELSKRGAQVTVRKTDVADANDVAAMFDEIDRTLPPLRGIMHAAMVLEDSLLLNLDRDLMKRVLAPKVQGTWNLHVQTAHRPLDFFVMFSSLSSVFGHAGQGNYAAANLFLDALAHHRRAAGLPALTVNWGYLGEVGYLAQRPQLGERLERQGVKSFSVRQALTLLDRALQRQLVQVSVMRVEWSRWRGLGVTGRMSPRFSHLLKDKNTSAGEETSGSLPPFEAVRSAPPTKRRDVVGSLLSGKIARILGAAPDKLDPDRSLLQLGIDSLMGIELRNWIEEELHIVLPVVELMRSPSLTRLTDLALEHWDEADGHTDSAFSDNGESAGHDGTAISVNGAAASVNGDDDGAFPLSHGQRGLWLMHQMDPSQTVFNISLPIRFRFQLDLAAFRRAWDKLVQRHLAGRTTFEDRDGVLLQKVQEVAVPLEVVNVSGWSERKLRQRLIDEAHRPFDLERGPVTRGHLFSRAADDHVFLMSFHHIVGDFWSLVVILEEMRILYAAERDGRPAALPPRNKEYRDFVRWQAELLNGREGERLWAWWQRQLADAPSVLELPADKPRPPRRAYRGGDVLCRIDPELTRRLKAIAAQEQVTLYAVLLGAFQTLLGRYTGMKDFLIGSPFAGRSRPEFANIVGYFINVLPLRADLSGNPTARTVLRRAWRAVLDAMAHQDFPFPLLVERLNVPREAARAPLVQVLFALERAHRPEQRGAWQHFLPRQDGGRTVDGLRLDNFHIEQRTSQYDLELALEESDDAVAGVVRYDPDLFEEATVRRLVDQFKNLLEAFAGNPDGRVFELPLLSESEHRQVVHDWNQTQQDLPTGLCLHDLFEQQARRTPRATALTSADRNISYAELDRWADRLAKILVDRGVKPDTYVALYLERSPEMIAAMLGVMKAGGAYVPLDPNSPGEKIKNIVSQAQPVVLLTQKHLKARLPELETEIACVEDLSADTGPNGRSARRRKSRARPENVAYVIFTSGTTGRPKGVMVEHHSVCNVVQWQPQALPVGPNDTCVLCVDYCFDASVTGIFVPLAVGARLVLPPPGEERDPGRFLERAIREKATIIETLPSMLGMWLDNPRFAECRSLRWLSSGGEVLPPEMAERLFRVLPVDLYNFYGPTETTIEATWWKCVPGDSHSVIPIGRPVANLQTYVLDEHRQPVPIGVAGELWVGGVGVARGYLNDPERTAERFFPDPFRSETDARLYRTGDRCRWLPNGALEYLSRVDQQVKVRGYRIELEEIENLLCSHPDVREAAVGVQGDGVGAQRLVAYIVPRDNSEPVTADRLRRHLRGYLPDYALPAAYVPMPALPRTPVGKLDRKALPLPILERPDLEQPYVAPRTPLESYLGEVWQELLQIDRVGIDDNFFELGGSSILGVRVINRIQEKMDQYVYVVALFETPTISGLTRYLCETFPDDVRRAFGPESLPSDVHQDGSTNGFGFHPGRNGNGQPSPEDLIAPLQPKGSLTPLFLVHPPGGIVVCYQPLARYIGRDRPLYGIRARGLHGETNLPQNMDELITEYLAAIRTVQSEGPYHIGGWSSGGVFALEMAQRLKAEGDDVGLLLLLDTVIPHNPANRRYVGEEDLSLREYGVNLTVEELDQLGPEGQLPYLWDHAKKLKLVEAEAPLPHVRQILDELKRFFHAHMQMATDYAVRPYAGALTLFRPTEAPVDIAMLPDRGWSQLADTVDVHFVPGQHHSMVQEPHVETLAQKLRHCLAQAESIQRKERTLIGQLNGQGL